MIKKQYDNGADNEDDQWKKDAIAEGEPYHISFIYTRRTRIAEDA